MQDDIHALEARRYAAMEAGDLEALGALLSDRLVYSHSDGSQDTKASYLETLAGGTLRYRKTWHTVKTVLPAGADAAVALGTMGADITRHGTDRTIGSLTCAVWAREGDAWRLLAYQPTSLPKA